MLSQTAQVEGHTWLGYRCSGRHHGSPAEQWGYQHNCCMSFGVQNSSKHACMFFVFWGSIRAFYRRTLGAWCACCLLGVTMGASVSVGT